MIKILMPLAIASETLLPITNEKMYVKHYENTDDYVQKILEEFWDVVYGPKLDKQPEAIFVDNTSELILAIRFIETKKALERCRKVNDIMNSSVELQGIRILPILRQLQKLKNNIPEKLVIVAEKGIKVEAYVDFLSDGKYMETSTGNYEAIVDGKKIAVIESSTRLEKNMNIEIPPLRKRKEDIPYMIDRALSLLHSRYKNIPVHFPDEQTLRMFTSYDWPGNTQELLETVYAYATGNDVVDHLMGANTITTDGKQIDLKNCVNSMVAKIEKQFIYDALQKTSWNRKKASAVLKMNYKTFCYKMKKYGISRR
ncbi:MAG TPA: helix-turn-helix domain-containing protein [Pseudothermotoga sp.]